MNLKLLLSYQEVIKKAGFVEAIRNRVQAFWEVLDVQIIIGMIASAYALANPANWNSHQRKLQQGCRIYTNNAAIVLPAFIWVDGGVLNADIRECKIFLEGCSGVWPYNELI